MAGIVGELPPDGWVVYGNYMHDLHQNVQVMGSLKALVKLCDQTVLKRWPVGNDTVLDKCIVVPKH